MSERTTVRLPEHLLRRAKEKARAERRTLTSLIEDGLRLVVSGAGSHREAGRRLRPRVSSACGGLMPGMDPVRLMDVDEEAELSSRSTVGSG